MSLIPWKSRQDPMRARQSLPGPIMSLRDEMDRVFERAFREPWAIEGPGAWTWMPTVDVAEKDDAVTITAEVPGIDPENIEVSLSGNVLTISGTKGQSTEEKGEDRYHCERRFGSFRRSIELPATADLQSATAEHRNGVLTVRVARSAAAKPRRVAVRRSAREGAEKKETRKPALAGAGR